MTLFSSLYRTLEQTTSTNAKVEAMAAYFREAPPEDAAWAVYVLSGRRLLRLLPSKLLRAWTMELAGVSEWLLDECYAAVGDLAETTALLLDGIASRRSTTTVHSVSYGLDASVVSPLPLPLSPATICRSTKRACSRLASAGHRRPAINRQTVNRGP